jgi:Flp pilus assembly protein CpaB
VWSITSGLSAGSTLTADDLDVVTVRLDETASRYVGADSDPVGQTLGRDLSAGELLPLAALSDAVDAGMLLTVPVDAAHAPVGLRRGDRVDVYVTPRSEAGRAGATELVLPSAVVDTVDSNDQRFGGSGEAIGVVLSVPQPVVERLVAGARRGDVDLVLVPGQR